MVGDQQLIFEFTGREVAGAVRILKDEYEKNGKWSYSTWTVELADDIESFTWSQDWETGRYFVSRTWETGMAEARAKAGDITLTDEALERFIRARLPKAAEIFDAAEKARTVDPEPVLRELLEAQAELAAARTAKAEAEAAHSALATEVQAAIDARAAAEAARKETEATKQRVQAAKAAMKRGASLEDLKALLAQ